MAYVSQEMKAEIAPVVKKILTKYGLKGTLSVRNYSALVLTISKGKLDFLKAYEEATGRKVTNIDVNVYHINNIYSGKMAKCLSELVEALKGPRYFDHSDAMIDYFHRSHYIDINIGRWNKPYEVI